MVANDDRRRLLRDKAIEVLAAGGGRLLTHRQVDKAAGVPVGTTKNYYPTRDALLIATAERVYERYLDDQRQLESYGGPTTREQLIALIAELFRRAATVDRPRLLALLALHAEAPQHPALQDLLVRQTAIDFAMYERLQRSAGLPVTPERSHVIARCMQAALVSLVAHHKEGLAAQGLNDFDGYVRRIIDVVYPP